MSVPGAGSVPGETIPTRLIEVGGAGDDVWAALAAPPHGVVATRRDGNVYLDLRSVMPDLYITLSSEVCPEVREFERTSTAATNAYVQPLMARYLDRVQASLEATGFRGNLYIMLSGGGITTVREAKDFPIRLIESGPAAGAMASNWARSRQESTFAAFARRVK